MLPLERLTVGGLLRRTAGHHPERPALKYMEQVWNYAQFDREVDRMARCLLGWGIRKGDHLAIWCEAEPTALFLLYASVRIGAVTALINTSLGREEVAALLKSSDITRLIIGDGYKALDYPALCRGLTEELPKLEDILYVGTRSFPHMTSLPELEAAMASPEELKYAEALVYPEDTAFLLYTSGTTSLPKAVLGNHYSRANSGIQQAHDLGATEEDSFCMAMPMFHCFCLTVNLMAACAVGACVCLPPSRRTEALLRTISEEKCTILSCVPALFHALLARPDFSTWDLSSLRTGFIGGSSYPSTLFSRIERELGMTLLSSLGQTEATAGLTAARLTDPLEVRAATVGHFMDHLEGKIVHPRTGIEQPVGEPGEICIRGYMVMQGYYNQPEETAKVIDREGWLHTGDMGYLDEGGNIHLTGRLKELIIRGGENISPAEIETTVLEDERVEDCKAVGVPDSHYGEEVCLCVVLKPTASLTEKELRDRLSGQLAAFKLPKYILFMDSLPVTLTGKVRAQQLKEQAASLLSLSI